MAALAAGLAGCVRGDLRKGERCLALGDAVRAERLFSSVLDRVPDEARARRGLGLSLLVLARDRADDGEDVPSNWGRAVRELERADTLTDSVVKSGLLDGRTRWARSLAARGDTLRAEEILEDLVVASPRSTGPRGSLAILLARTGYHERAEELFLQNAVIDSTNPDTWFNLGLLAWNQDRHREAAEFFLKAERYAPADPEILWWASRSSSGESP